MAEIREIKLCDIEVEVGRNPRTHFPDFEHRKLVENIRSVGLIHPLTVEAATNSGKYTIVQGERRLRALQAIEKEDKNCEYAELYNFVPCTVLSGKNKSDKVLLALAENEVRHNLSIAEVGRALEDLSVEFPKLKKKEIAEMAGISERRASTIRSIMKLPNYVLDLMARDGMSEITSYSETAEYTVKTHTGIDDSKAWELYRLWKAKVPDDEITEFAGKIRDKFLTLEAVRKHVDKRLEKSPAKKKEPLRGAYKKAQDALLAHFGDVVQVKKKKNGGCTFVFEVAEDGIAEVQAMLTRGEPAYGSQAYNKAHPVEYAALLEREAAAKAAAKDDYPLPEPEPEPESHADRRTATEQEVHDFSFALCTDAAIPGFADTENPDNSGNISREYFVYGDGEDADEDKVHYELISPSATNPETLDQIDLREHITRGVYALYILDEDTAEELPYGDADAITEALRPYLIDDYDVGIDENEDEDEADTVYISLYGDCIERGEAQFDPSYFIEKFEDDDGRECAMYAIPRDFTDVILAELIPSLKGLPVLN